MYPTYTGQKTGLAADDIAGIQSIYSAGLPRTPDVYYGANSSFATAANMNSADQPDARSPAWCPTSTSPRPARRNSSP